MQRQPGHHAGKQRLPGRAGQSSTQTDRLVVRAAEDLAHADHLALGEESGVGSQADGGLLSDRNARQSRSAT